MKQIKVLSVFGTRPEAIKMAPLVKVLNATPEINSLVCVTAQHRQMMDQVLEKFEIVPDYDLNLMKAEQTLQSITTGVLEGVSEVLRKVQPDLVLVHGDTTTSMAAALAAFYQKIAVGHVEAGLRSFDKYSPFPEEMNRVITGHIATLNFSPTEKSAENLRKEAAQGEIFVTGNTVIDALKQMIDPEYVFVNEDLRKVDLTSARTILVTAHRRENIGEPMKQICRALLRLVTDLPTAQIIFPMHMNPEVRKVVTSILGGQPRIKLIEPLCVGDIHNLLTRVHLVMTDSGGLQEEAPALGKPVVVLRTETERPEVVEAGKAVIAGVDEQVIYETGYALMTDDVRYAQMAEAINPYGDGTASVQIVQHILKWAAAGKK